MKIEWLVNDVTAVGSPDRAEHAILGVILARPVQCKSCRIPWQSRTWYFGCDFGWASFWPIQVVFAAGNATL